MGDGREARGEHRVMGTRQTPKLPESDTALADLGLDSSNHGHAVMMDPEDVGGGGPSGLN